MFFFVVFVKTDFNQRYKHRESEERKITIYKYSNTEFKFSAI